MPGSSQEAVQDAIGCKKGEDGTHGCTAPWEVKEGVWAVPLGHLIQHRQ